MGTNNMSVKKQKGFFQIEIAIALIFIGIMLLMVINILSIINRYIKTEYRTVTTLNEKASYIVDYAYSYYSLPEEEYGNSIINYVSNNVYHDYSYIPNQQFINFNNSTDSRAALCKYSQSNITIRSCSSTDCSTYTERADKDFAFAITTYTDKNNPNLSTHLDSNIFYDYSLLNKQEKVFFYPLSRLRQSLECDIYILDSNLKILPVKAVARGINTNISIKAAGGVPDENNGYRYCIEVNKPSSVPVNIVHLSTTTNSSALIIDKSVNSSNCLDASVYDNWSNNITQSKQVILDILYNDLIGLTGYSIVPYTIILRAYATDKANNLASLGVDIHVVP